MLPAVPPGSSRAPDPVRFRAEPLDPDRHDLAKFSCGEPSLDLCLREQALAATACRTARTWVWTDHSGKVAGYYALAAHKVARYDVRARADAAVRWRSRQCCSPEWPWTTSCAARTSARSWSPTPVPGRPSHADRRCTTGRRRRPPRTRRRVLPTTRLPPPPEQPPARPEDHRHRSGARPVAAVDCRESRLSAVRPGAPADETVPVGSRSGNRQFARPGPVVLPRHHSEGSREAGTSTSRRPRRQAPDSARASGAQHDPATTRPSGAQAAIGTDHRGGRGRPGAA